MTDPFAEGEVHEQGEAAPFVVRISRTASGARTYTVGATLTRDDVPEAIVDALLDIERLVAAGLDGQHRSARRSGNGVTGQLRKSLIVEVLRKVRIAADRPEAAEWESWYTTVGLLVAIPGAKRSQLVADLSALVRDGLVEKQTGVGTRRESRYRLAAQRDLAIKVERAVEERH